MIVARMTLQGEHERGALQKTSSQLSHEIAQ